MTAAEGDLFDRARDAIAARITVDYPGWSAGHDLFGWHAQRLDDGHIVRATGPDGLRAMIGVAPPCASSSLAAEVRRAYPGWHIWQDARGCWHARRRGNFREQHEPGAPVYAVHEQEIALLRERLAEQEELDRAAS